MMLLDDSKWTAGDREQEVDDATLVAPAVAWVLQSSSQKIIKKENWN